MLSTVACPVLPYFSTLCNKNHYFRKKTDWIQNVFWLSLQSLSKHFSFCEQLSKIWWEIYIGLEMRWEVRWGQVRWEVWWGEMCWGELRWSEVKLLLSDFNEMWIFSTACRKILVRNFIKIRLVVAELLHADRLTDITKLIVTLRNFCERAWKDRNFVLVTKCYEIGVLVVHFL